MERIKEISEENDINLTNPKIAFNSAVEKWVNIAKLELKRQDEEAKKEKRKSEREWEKATNPWSTGGNKW